MRRYGHMRLASSETTVRPMRHVSDTKNCFSDMTVAASSYESGTSGHAVVPPVPSMPDSGISWLSYDHARDARGYRYQKVFPRYKSSGMPATNMPHNATKMSQKCQTTLAAPRSSRPQPTVVHSAQQPGAQLASLMLA